MERLAQLFFIVLRYYEPTNEMTFAKRLFCENICARPLLRSQRRKSFRRKPLPFSFCPAYMEEVSISQRLRILEGRRYKLEQGQYEANE